VKCVYSMLLLIVDGLMFDKNVLNYGNAQDGWKGECSIWFIYFWIWFKMKYLIFPTMTLSFSLDLGLGLGLGLGFDLGFRISVLMKCVWLKCALFIYLCECSWSI